jgi:hypothetical protein
MLVLRRGMFLLSLTATCQVWTVSLKAGLNTYNRHAGDGLQLTLRFSFRQQLKAGVMQPSLISERGRAQTQKSAFSLEDSQGLW